MPGATIPMRSITLSIVAPGRPVERRTFWRSRIVLASRSLDYRSEHDEYAMVDLRTEITKPVEASIFLLAEGVCGVDEEGSRVVRVNAKRVDGTFKLSTGDRITVGNTQVTVEAIDLHAQMDVSELPPQYFSVRIMEKCKHCGSGLPINTLSQSIVCNACKETNAFGVEAWRSILGTVEEVRARLLTGGPASGNRYFMSCYCSPDIDWEAASPRCPSCGAHYSPEQLTTACEGHIACPSCGALAPTQPAPEWIRSSLETLQQVYCTEEPVADGPRQHAGQTPGELVAMRCPSCGGAVKVGAESARVVPCVYCGTSNYVPDDLWQHLRPAKKTTSWYVRFQGPLQKHVDQFREVRASFKEAVGRAEGNASNRQATRNHTILFIGSTLFVLTIAAIVGWCS